MCFAKFSHIVIIFSEVRCVLITCTSWHSPELSSCTCVISRCVRLDRLITRCVFLTLYLSISLLCNRLSMSLSLPPFPPFFLSPFFPSFPHFSAWISLDRMEGGKEGENLTLSLPFFLPHLTPLLPLPPPPFLSLVL